MPGIEDLLGGMQMPEPMGQGQSILAALAQTMGQQADRGVQRHSTAMGGIAEGLLPLAQAIAQAPMLQQKSQLENFKMRLQLTQLLAQMQKMQGDPEMRAAKIGQLKALASQETSLAEKRKGDATYRQQLSEQLQGLISGGGAGQSGMKPSVTMGTSGPSISYRSDVMSPEAFSQQSQLAQMRTGQQLQKEEQLAKYKSGLSSKTNPKAADALASAKTLMEMLDEADAKVASIPKDMGRGNFAWNAGKYQGRSEHPTISNLLTGGSMGFINADTDPRLDEYFSWVGQAQSALASFNIAGMRGGYRTIQYLRDHFPGYGDSPAAAASKAKWLRDNKGIVQEKIKSLQDQLMKPAQAATAVDGVQEGGWVGRQIFNKAGEEYRLWQNPTTGESKILKPEEAPPL